MVLIALLACVCTTWIGGLLASRLARTPYHWDVVAFSAGAVLGVALLDLFPEALEMAQKQHVEPHALFLSAMAGFIVFNVLERVFHTHSCRREGHVAHAHALRQTPLGALALSLHSTLDGLLLGLAFLVGAPIGMAVAAGLLGHRFCDGVNVVASEHACDHVDADAEHGAPSRLPLLVNSLAPVLGYLLSLAVQIPASCLPYILSGFAGFFLYLGASDLLPSSQNGNPHPRLLAWTACGCGVMLALTHLAHLAHGA